MDSEKIIVVLVNMNYFVKVYVHVCRVEKQVLFFTRKPLFC